MFTDFGPGGPYVGQVEVVLHARAPGVPVVGLVADAPACNPQAAAYLLAALMPDLPAGVVVLAVVDPGVGGERRAVLAEVDGRWLVGPDNGLFELMFRRATRLRVWDIIWRPDCLSATFHGRDLFAPVAARLATGATPEIIGCVPISPPSRPDWPDDWPAVIYFDPYGNAFTGTRAASLAADAHMEIGGRRLARGRIFTDVPPGTAFWYENSCGLAEIAVNGGRADTLAGIALGANFRMS